MEKIQDILTGNRLLANRKSIHDELLHLNRS